MIAIREVSNKTDLLSRASSKPKNMNINDERRAAQNERRTSKQEICMRLNKLEPNAIVSPSRILNMYA